MASHRGSIAYPFRMGEIAWKRKGGEKEKGIPTREKLSQLHEKLTIDI